MIEPFEVISKNKLAYRHHLTETSPEVLRISRSIESGSFDFSSNKFKRYDGRLVTEFEDLSAENIILLHLKHVLKNTFKVHFSNRNKIVDELIDKLKVARSLNDLTILKFDFKEYFYSISTQYVYDRFIKNSKVLREDKNYLEKLCDSNRYCVAGLPVFNYFVEMISTEFDTNLRASLASHGLVYYARYVDDGLVILNTFMAKKKLREILNDTLELTFHSSTSLNKVKIKEEKFTVINRRHLSSDVSFDFLGYEFFVERDFKTINIGITESKRTKYQQKINKLIKANYIAGNTASEEKVRQLIKAHCSRVVYYAPSKKHKGVWVSKGIIANYNRLKDYPNNIDSDTIDFLQNLYIKAFKNAGYSVPAYLSNNRYSLWHGVLSNRAMIFNELIGCSKKSLLAQMAKLSLYPSPSREYDYLVKDYLIEIKVGY
jgi:hypothetical protein